MKRQITYYQFNKNVSARDINNEVKVELRKNLLHCKCCIFVYQKYLIWINCKWNMAALELKSIQEKSVNMNKDIDDVISENVKTESVKQLLRLKKILTFKYCIRKW